jgi:hypothetical protein
MPTDGLQQAGGSAVGQIETSGAGAPPVSPFWRAALIGALGLYAGVAVLSGLDRLAETDPMRQQ